ncbi:cytosolic carboxypeptidase 1-like [Watersipora subatra]|uniref:cytosolic carboxypeptidase 1-like n=1 Tax=Watersipora subatra TaxID=2589382 RepID=UPI00355C16B8
MADAKGATGHSSSMKGGSSPKLDTYVQLLEKMSLSSTAKTLNSDDLQQARHAASRIFQHIAALERSSKEHLCRNSSFIKALLTSLEANKDFTVSKLIVDAFAELIGRTNTGTRCANLVEEDTTKAFFQLLVRESKNDIPDEFVLQVHHVLSKLALKDRKFGVKGRRNLALPVTLSFLRSHTHSAAAKSLQPVLNVLKSYANNATNASELGEKGAVAHLFKVVSNVNKKNMLMTKVALETLVLILKSKSNSRKAVECGGVPMVLQMYREWHKIDTKNRQVALRKALLHILKHVTNTKVGRQAVIDGDGVALLYTTCEDIMDVRELDSFVFISSIILRKCFPRQKLPANATKAALLFKLPESDFHVPQSLSKDAALLNGITVNMEGREYEDSSLDNDDDRSSNDEAESDKPGSGLSGGDRTDDAVHKRSLEDLRMYQQFFPEVLDIEVGEEFLPDMEHKNEIESDEQTSRRGVCDSNFGCQHYPEGSGRTSWPDATSRPDITSWPVSDTAPATSLKGKPQNGTVLNGGCRARELLDAGASAVNMKTGQPVFSLDIPVGTPSSRSKGKNSFPERKIKLKRREKSTKKVESLPDLHTLQIEVVNESEVDAQFSADEWVSPEDFYAVARKTNSVGKFNKIAYPDLHGSKLLHRREKLYDRKFGIQRAKIFEDLDRMVNSDSLLNKTVYDFEESFKLSEELTSEKWSSANRDVERLGKPAEPYDHLHFNSHFECGNLRKAIQVKAMQYDLILCPDVNTNHHHQWFYFEVSNMVADKPYQFNIINNEKVNSQFNSGMQPVMYSVQSAVNGEPSWSRVGTDVCYFRNNLSRSLQVTGGAKGKLYYTTTFTVTFRHSYDVCYIAYHYPYTYSTLQCQLLQWQRNVDGSPIYFKNQVLCQSLGGNDVNVLTITDYPSSKSKEAIEQFRNKPYIFLTGRVHPGESNASWIMKGTIEHLLSNSEEAIALRQTYIFKIVPMLNPDGVINGNHRCSLVAEDLNRRWLVSCPKLHPTIYHTKGMLLFMKQMQRTPLVYCDYHGHSRKKNVFLYGCSASQSWMTDDVDNPSVLADKTEDMSYKMLPKILAHNAQAFSMSSCSFSVEKAKEATGRVVVWRQIGVLRSYTMESTFCGCDQGQYSGSQINLTDLQVMGSKFVDALLKLKSRNYKASYLDEPELKMSAEDTTLVFQDDNSADYDDGYLEDNLSDGISEDEDDDELQENVIE